MNKLMARIVAVVLAVMMLGTVSFAANLNADNNVIPAPEADVTSEFTEVWTVKATAENGTIVAMYQDTKAPEAIAIDPAKLGDSKTVTVEYSGKNGDGKNTVTVDVNPKTSTLAVDVVENKITIDGVKYTDVLRAKKEFTLTGTVKELGYKLTAEGKYMKDGVETEATGVENEVKYTGTISGAGKVSFDVVLLGIPTTAEVTATPYIIYY